MSIKGIFPIEKWNFRDTSVFADLPVQDIKCLLANKVEKIYKKGEIIFREDSFPAGIFYLEEGKVKKYKLDKEGREHIIYVANTGDLLGYHSVLSDDRYTDSAAALELCRISFIPKEDFITTVNQSEILNRRLLKTLSHEFAVLSNSLTLFTQKSVRERLALQLIVLREKYKIAEHQNAAVEINMSRDDLSNLVGTARENVIRILSAFKEHKIIATQGRKIIVLDVKKLIEIANYQ
jgi:CRP-like cAMP-binding protein